MNSQKRISRCERNKPPASTTASNVVAAGYTKTIYVMNMPELFLASSK
jgi:hypothetical protein